jgi:hypothetical protein
MTSIYIYGPKADGSAPEKLTPLPISALVIATWNLLEEAADLPQPVYLSVSDLQSISLQFAPDPSSLRAITRWALRFGGVATSKPRKGKRGPETWCRVEFDYYGVAIDAYAHVPAGTATV